MENNDVMQSAHGVGKPGEGGHTVRPSGVQERTDRFLEEATAIADEILRRRTGTSPSWQGASGYGTSLNPVETIKLGPHLYNGTAGIALFLAAMGHVTGQTKYSEAALGVFAPLARKLRELARDEARAREIDIPVGGLIGLGAFIYCLLRAAEWLDQPDWIDDARAAAGLITPDRIAQDPRVRIQTGDAGAILALLALHKVSPGGDGPGPAPLDVARDCARHILATQVAFEERPRAWLLSPNKPPLLGFCYGAAGVSFSLLKLFEASPAPDLWASALEGLSYVDSYYLPGERRWSDVRAMLQSRYAGPAEGTWRDWWLSGRTDTSDLLPRTPAPDGGDTAEPSITLANKWCHGAPGLAMARISCLSLLVNPAIRDEIQGALEETRQFATAEIFAEHPADDLCCGHMGRVEALLYASQQLADPGLEDAARTLAWRVVERARDGGAYTLTAARGSASFAPSLFQGLAGVGYTLLRLARPGALPCLLLLE